MSINPYIGHANQLSGVEEVRLVGGKGDGMRLLQIRNGKGLEITVSADRCADLSRVTFKGDNMGYFSPCGYVAPGYYDKDGLGFLKSFTAGFLTTCGLSAVGSPCEDDGEVLPLHGTIANTPCEHIWWTEDDEKIEIHATVNDSRIFARKLVLNRVITVLKAENRFLLTDTVENQGDTVSPLMLLYHMNMGYPLLSENAIVEIPSVQISPLDAHAAEDIDTWNKMLKPIAGYAEECYFHEFEKEGFARIYNPDIAKGVEIRFDLDTLTGLTEWKMMGVRDYVLGLEPGNCAPKGRDKIRQSGKLRFIEPGQQTQFRISVSFVE